MMSRAEGDFLRGYTQGLPVGSAHPRVYVNVFFALVSVCALARARLALSLSLRVRACAAVAGVLSVSRAQAMAEQKSHGVEMSGPKIGALKIDNGGI